MTVYRRRSGPSLCARPERIVSKKMTTHTILGFSLWLGKKALALSYGHRLTNKSLHHYQPVIFFGVWAHGGLLSRLCQSSCCASAKIFAHKS